MRCLVRSGNRSSARLEPRRQRRGTVLVVVLVVLVLLTAILGSSVRTGLAGRELLSLQERVRQAEWLAESGLNRAAARLADDPDYEGETWMVPAVELLSPARRTRPEREGEAPGEPSSGSSAGASPSRTVPLADREAIGAHHDAVVRITVEADDASEHQRRITATAEFPVGADPHATRTRSLLVDLGHDDTTNPTNERDRDNENNEAPQPSLEETR